MALIDELINENWLKDPKIIEAFKLVKRKDFMPEGLKDMAELNEAIPIGYGQTISQPLVVAFMLEKLDPEAGNKILDIGSGSGYTTALLSQIVGEKGKVIGIEIISELRDFGEKNADKYYFVKKGIAEFIIADGTYGYKKEAPYDRILVSASSDKILELWKKQLKIGGIIVCSIKNSIFSVKKKSETEFEEEEFPGFIFVPLIDTKNEK